MIFVNRTEIICKTYQSLLGLTNMHINHLILINFIWLFFTGAFTTKSITCFATLVWRCQSDVVLNDRQTQRRCRNYLTAHHNITVNKELLHPINIAILTSLFQNCPMRPEK